MKRFLGAVILVGSLIGITVLALTEPRPLKADALPQNAAADIEKLTGWEQSIVTPEIPTLEQSA